MQLNFLGVQSFPGSGNEAEVSSQASGLLFCGKFPSLGACAVGKSDGKQNLYSHQVKKIYQKAIFFPSFLSIANFT